MRFKDEAELQKYIIETLEEKDFAVYNIETEETYPGFPDLLAMPTVHNRLYQESFLLEVKLPDGKGYVKFQRQQLRFFRRFAPVLDVKVGFYYEKEDRIYLLDAQSAVNIALDKGSRRIHTDELLNLKNNGNIRKSSLLRGIKSL